MDLNVKNILTSCMMAAGLAVLPDAVNAEMVINGATVGLVGTQFDGGGIVVQYSAKDNPDCLNGVMYFTNPKVLNKALAVALMAKATGKTVRIDFDRDSSTKFCTGVSIFVE